ncbi:MAG: ElyC/SanA/YdcF family protein [Acidimicrobiia bacterium]|nr:ElyC/SanA/YdcF family protein [Acidimicrobiia bacterium]
MSSPRDDPAQDTALPEIVMMSDTVGAVDLDSRDRPDVSAVPEPLATAIGVPTGETEVLDAASAPVEPSAESARPRRRKWPWVLASVGIVLGTLGLYFAVSFWQVWSVGNSDQARPVDAIVVMGAAQYDGRPSPQLAARLDHVVDLWDDGLAPVVITTGGNLPGDRFTEAEASATYLVERGVPAAAILMENSGSTSYESLDAVAGMMESRGLDSVLVVTDPYHALRSRLIAQEVGMTAYVSPTPYSVVSGRSSLRRHVSEAAGVALGRIIGFERLSGLTS